MPSISPTLFSEIQSTDPERAKRISDLAAKLKAEYRRAQFETFWENCVPRPVEDEEADSAPSLETEAA